MPPKSQKNHSYDLRKAASSVPYKRIKLDATDSIIIQPSVSPPQKSHKKPLSKASKLDYVQKVKPLSPAILSPIQMKSHKLTKTLFKTTESLISFENLAQKVRQGSSTGFYLSIKDSEKMIDETDYNPTFQLMDIKEKPIEVEENKDEAEELEIVDNNNKKIKIKVSRLSGKTTLKSFENVPNLIDFKARQQEFESLKFLNDFKSGYAPIEIQHNQERDFTTSAKEKKDSKQQHFIRKKQSCAAINLKRTCGVSYVKPSESQQKDVSHVFEKLAPLVFQCSSECDEVADITIFQPFFQKLFTKPKWLICTILDADADELIREYLLKPEKRESISKGKIYLVKDYKDLWPLFLDKLFIMVHFFYDKDELIVPIDVQGTESIEELKEIIKKSQYQLGILLKKNLSGKKSFVKTLGPAFNNFLIDEDQNETVTTEILGSSDTPPSNITTQNPTPSAKSQQKPITSETLEPLKSIEETTGKPKFLTSLMNKLQGYFFKKVEQSPEQLCEDTLNINSISTTVNSPIKSMNTSGKPGFFYGVNPSILNYLQKDPKMKNINTCSVRMELYLQEGLWKSLTDVEKNKLNGLILFIDDAFQQEALPMSNKRMETFEAKDPSILSQALKEITMITKNGNEALTPEAIFPKFSEKTKGFGVKEFSSFGLPLYFISTRDCFAFDLLEKKTILQLPGRPNVLKTEYYFHPKGKPQNFKSFEAEFPDLRVGVTSYTNFFSHEELVKLEEKTFETEIKCFKKHFLPMTAQATFTSEKVRRTKFFFGVRYMWSKQQIAEPFSNIGAGVRCDVSPPPEWLKKNIEAPLVQGGVIPKDFINSITMNVYHDGKEGLAQHFDDAVRFKQPIYSVRLFSDCRLSFGSQFYGFCNGAFCIPLPRGCIAVLEENSYAANGVKHCVRPCDMTGKSAAIILRQMHEKCLQDARKLDEFVDFPAWFSTLSMNENSIGYDEQKRMEAEINLQGGNKGSNAMSSY